ncbi:MAG TPA: VOC family protein [Clostridia bacterium]|nr:VOC family protein [Clostridia bacterium]
MFRYAHTNLIARDCRRLIEFYKEVFHCRSIGEQRDLAGPWLDALTGLHKAHIVGEHLCLPGYGDDHPTLEIFSYDALEDRGESRINACGLAHLAFEVEDVEETVRQVLKAGGSLVGEVVSAAYPDRDAVFAYAKDPEGNIVELQSWRERASE